MTVVELHSSLCKRLSLKVKKGMREGAMYRKDKAFVGIVPSRKVPLLSLRHELFVPDSKSDRLLDKNSYLYSFFGVSRVTAKQNRNKAS